MNVKIFIINMNTQNIFNFYGHKLNVKLDHSEYYDYELTNVNDIYTDILDFNTPKNYESLIFDSTCLNGLLNDYKPLEFIINESVVIDDCDVFIIKPRTEKGWTLDFVFDKENNTWDESNVFYYWGIKNENEPLNYADNNLSFSFTPDKKILWQTIRYSLYCDEISGFTPTYEIETGMTPTLCIDEGNFNITITFERYKELKDCDILNEGGLNDLITGYTISNVLNVITGETPNYQLIEVLNQKWLKEKNSRLGILKIYLNGYPIYKLENWEEIIPSKRESENLLVQIWGGGTNGIMNIHNGFTKFNMKSVKYFEEPLNYLNVKHHYITKIKSIFNIVDCKSICISNVS